MPDDSGVPPVDAGIRPPTVGDLSGDADERPGLVRRGYLLVKFPPPVEAELFPTRKSAATYLGAWCLSITYVVLWVLLAIGIISKTRGHTIAVSLFSFASTCLLVWMVLTIRRRLELTSRGHARELLTSWWRGPWDPIGRQIWLPVRFGAAWTSLRQSEPGVPGSTPSDRDPPGADPVG